MQLESELTRPPPGLTQQQVFQDFIGIWMQAALDPSLPGQERSAVPFVTLFLHLSQPMRDRIRDAIVPQVLTAGGGSHRCTAALHTAHVASRTVDLDPCLH